MGNGYVGAYGAAGGRDALEELVAQRLKETLLKQQEADRAHGRQMAEGNLGISERNTALGENRFGYQQTRDTQADEAAAAAKAERAQVVAGLPEWLQGAANAQGVGLDFEPQDLLEAPEKREDTDRRKVRLTKIEDDIRTDNEIRQARSMPRSQSTRLVQVAGPNGAPIWVPESQAAGMPAAQAQRGVTGAERQVLAYYNRAKDAEDTITGAGGEGPSLEDRISKAGITTQLGAQYLPNMLQSSDQQAYRQAQRAFTEARLRKESGAAIPTDEYENDARTYFAQPGDTPETINQKRQKRQTVLEGLKFASGRAHDEYYGGQGPASAQVNMAGEYDFVNGKLVPRKKQ